MTVTHPGDDVGATADIVTGGGTEETPAGPAASPRRRKLVAALIAVATLLAVVSAMTTWVRLQLLDTDQWVDVSNELLVDDEIRSALSAYLGAQLVQAVDLQAELEALLPPRFEGLAASLAGLVRVSTSNAVDRVLESDRFADLWERANRRTHEAIVTVLRGEDLGPLATADGVIGLELGDALRQIGGNLGLPERSLDRIPPEFGRITVVASDDLAAAQRVVRTTQIMSWVILLTVIGLYAAAVILAAGRRLVALRNIGFALVAGGAVLLASRLIGINITVGSVIRETSNESVATAVALVATALLRDVAWTGIVIGFTIALTATLLGDGIAVEQTRVQLRRLAASNGLVVAATALVIIAVAKWGPGGPFDRPVSAVILIIAIVAGAAAVTHRVRAEAEAEALLAGDR